MVVSVSWQTPPQLDVQYLIVYCAAQFYDSYLCCRWKKNSVTLGQTVSLDITLKHLIHIFPLWHVMDFNFSSFVHAHISWRLWWGFKLYKAIQNITLNYISSLTKVGMTHLCFFIFVLNLMVSQTRFRLRNLCETGGTRCSFHVIECYSEWIYCWLVNGCSHNCQAVICNPFTLQF